MVGSNQKSLVDRYHLYAVSSTMSHGSAYTVVRATQQVSGKWQFWGVRIL